MSRDPARPGKENEAGWLPPIPGEANAVHHQEDKERYTSGDTDLDGNELHAAGRTCPRCGREIAPDEDVRLVSGGEYQHEACPVVLTHQPASD